MKIAVGLASIVLSMITMPVYANSYLQFLTTPPEERGDVISSAEEDYFSDIEDNNALPNAWWYDSRITTSAPVEVSQYPKYQAWLRAQNSQDQNDELLSREEMQRLLYAVEGGFVGWGLYNMYKY